MSLSCLTCGQALQRTDSYGDVSVAALEKENSVIRKKVDRSWSVNIASIKCEVPKVGSAVVKIKADHRRNFSTGNIAYSSGSEPKLVRSSGMRRDWSFENLVENQDQNIVRCH